MAEATTDLVEPELSTPERILQAAERLFSERGIGDVSLREITTAAGVNSAAAHYHFGSKDAVLEELFTRRAEPIARQREQMLGALKLNRQGTPQLEDVLRAFLKPALDLLKTPEGVAFTRLRARMVFEREEVRRQVMGKSFDRTNEMALQALAKALPKLAPTELYWRFHFMLGTMVYTMARPGRIEALTHDSFDTYDADAGLEQMVRFVAAGFRAP
ncbi:TetR/AcrR family transcriptional regulator [Piscinibacter sakaiensis]|uniref:TetR/AcrR family transcriptional regulator n=1 Tax=Piscinibacter sakaiensis TaxID=1547922 RepID=UPI003AABA08D